MQPRGGGFDRVNPYFVEHGQRHADHGLWWLFVFLFLALVVSLLVWVLLRLFDGRSAGRAQAVAPQLVAAPAGAAVLDVVRMRYAKGEIDRDEFIRMSSDLGGPLPPALQQPAPQQPGPPPQQPEPPPAPTE